MWFDRRTVLTVLLAIASVAAVSTFGSNGPVPSSLAAPNATSAAAPATATAAPLSLPELKAKYRRPDIIPFPKTNAFDPAKADLGRHLFFDPRISSNGSISCASCHDPDLDWADGRDRGVGVTGVPLPRRTPTVVNAAWLTALMWDGRASTLEHQASMPITAEHEMGMSLDDVPKRIQAIDGYGPLFEAAFPGEKIGIENVLAALATFQRTLVSSQAPFDHWIEGDETAISEGAQRGFLVFNGVGRCSRCHAGWRFTDDSFHDIGLESDDVGRGQFAPPSVVIMQHAFKTPSLRDLQMTGPYMHDGAMKTIDEVIKHYEDGGKVRPSLSPEMKPVKLTKQERDDLIAFLETLRGPPLPNEVPTLP